MAKNEGGEKLKNRKERHERKKIVNKELKKFENRDSSSGKEQARKVKKPEICRKGENIKQMML